MRAVRTHGGHRFPLSQADLAWPALLLLLTVGTTAGAVAASNAHHGASPATTVTTTTAITVTTTATTTEPARTVTVTRPPPTTTTPTTTVTVPADGLTGWPAGVNGYTDVLESIPLAAGRAFAVARARAAKAHGLPAAGVLVSSDYPSLHGGYYVVFSGTYRSSAAAAAALAFAHARGFADAYQARVAR